MGYYLRVFVLALILSLVACSSGNSSKQIATQVTEASTNLESLTKDWYTYTAYDGSYSVKFPGEPQKEEYKGFNMVNYEWHNLAFSVLGDDLPQANHSSGINAEQFLDTFVEELVGNYTLSSQDKLSKDGNPGRELTINNNNGLFYKIRVFLNSETSKMFQLGVLSNDESNLSSPETKAFFDSFKIAP